MKIVVSGYVGKKITGIGRNLMGLLDNTDPRKNQYVVYTNMDMTNDLKFLNSNVTLKTYNVSKMSSLGNLLWTTFIFPIKVAKEKADLALIPNFTLLLFKFKKTFIIMHDLIEFNVPDKFSKKKMFYRTKLADPISAKRANHIITVSQNSKRDIIKFLNIPEDKITVIYNGVDLTKFNNLDKEKSQKILQDKGWPLDYLLYAGTIDHPGKNSMGVIKVYELLRESNRYNGSLILAGMPGANHEAIDEYISKSKWKKDIVLTGFISDEELVALYSLCKVFVFISLYEGFGIPPIEAMACGAKVLTSNTSSLPEAVGDAGWTVDPQNIQEVSDKIIEILNSNIDNEKVNKHLSSFNWIDLSYKFEETLKDYA